MFMISEVGIIDLLSHITEISKLWTLFHQVG